MTSDYKPDYPERDHGYGKPPAVDGVPEIVTENMNMPPCPNCGCGRTFTLSVWLMKETVPPYLKVPEGHRVRGLYAGCPACPYASPMVMTAVAPAEN